MAWRRRRGVGVPFWQSHSFWRRRRRNELLTAISFERPVGPRGDTKADANDEEDHHNQADCKVGIELAGIWLHGPGVGAGVGQRLLLAADDRQQTARAAQRE